jgi:23S rRNA G2445 N2-methylase RlmL
VRGIEDVVAAEIGRRGVGEVVGTGHREVRFVAGSPAGVTALATADDVAVLATEVDGIGRSRSCLARLAAAVAAADLDAALAVRAECGGPPAATLDVSASSLGRRAFTRYDVEDAVGAALTARLGLPYRSRRGGARPPDGGLTWRVTVVDGRAAVSVRVAARPLHRRPWKVASVPGTLHPPLAAAMVALAGVGPGDVVLDPCCGAGTLAIEAAGAGAAAFGADLDPAAVAAAARNGRAAGVRWLRADAGALPVAAGSVRCALLNPPWGRRVAPAGTLARRPELLGREVRRVLAPGATAVALVPDVPGAGVPGLRVRRRIPVALAGARLVVLVSTRE